MNRDLVYARLFFSPDDDGGSNATESESREVAKPTESPKDGDGGQAKGKAASEFEAITSQDKLDAIVEARLNRQRQKLTNELTETIKQRLADEAKAAKAKSDGDFEALYKAETARRETAERDLETERRARLRGRIAAKHKLPDQLADRLSGETEEELETDAKALAKLVATREAPDTEAGSGSGTRRPAISDRPIRKEADESNRQTQTHTFNGQRKVAWPT